MRRLRDGTGTLVGQIAHQGNKICEAHAAARQPIYTRTAVNTKEKRDGFTKYKLDDGTGIWHERHKGAIDLAHDTFSTITEFGATPRAIKPGLCPMRRCLLGFPKVSKWSLSASSFVRAS